ncbi:MAG: hypothetical protein AAGH76_14160 [Pseudomonadota bacterium]
MTYLALLLVTKIAVTAVAVAAPLLLFSGERVQAVTGFRESDPAVFRLYGVAIVALLVGYGGGLWQLNTGVVPVGVMLMGLVSNIGAAVMMFVTGIAQKRPLGAVFFALIGGGFAVFLARPDLALQTL